MTLKNLQVFSSWALGYFCPKGTESFLVLGSTSEFFKASVKFNGTTEMSSRWGSLKLGSMGDVLLGNSLKL